jgi:enoyl-CoA hydratase/carnithine racemase
MSEERVATALEDHVAVVTLNDPPSRNALSAEMRSGLQTTLDRLAADDELRAVILAGAGQHFCAGGDLKGMTGLTGDTIRERLLMTDRLMRTMASSPVPLIAAVEGYALGAGLSLAMSCDIVVAGAGARFGAVFGKVGLGADLGLSWTLPMRIGLGRARMMLMTGRQITAEQGEAWGLADQVAPAGQALAVARQIACEISGMAPLSVRATRQTFVDPPSGVEDALARETEVQAFLADSRDFSEGVAAFLERRKPRFTGR